MLEMRYDGSSVTEAIREQCRNLEDYPGCASEDHFEISLTNV